MDKTDVVVIGAGQAGLCVSYLLRERGIEHVVLERGAVGESWRSQRWDSFCLNTPSWANNLPGLEFDPERPDAFGHRDEVVSFFERYVQTFGLPIREHAAVRRVERDASGEYAVHVDGDHLTARAVVLASGGMSRPRVPTMASELPEQIVSLAAGDYRNPKAVPDGAVVVVGSGQSGCQIAEDLLEGGRRVFLCASKVGRFPRTYRGRDVFAWAGDSGFFDVALDELDNPSDQFATQPQVSGTEGGHTVSLQSLARDGATLLGRAMGVDGDSLQLAGDLRESIAFGDEKAQFFRGMIDDWIERQGIDAEPPRADPGEPPLPDLNGSDQMRSLDLAAQDVGSVIWCIGFDADWSWVEMDVFDERGQPKHRLGITESEGLYFVGLPWLSKRKSGLLYGVAEDAARIVGHIDRDVLGR